MDERTITDADVDAIVARLEQRAAQRFQINVGRGVLGLAWKAMILLLIFLAGYGVSGKLPFKF